MKKSETFPNSKPVIKTGADVALEAPKEARASNKASILLGFGGGDLKSVAQAFRGIAAVEADDRVGLGVPNDERKRCG